MEALEQLPSLPFLTSGSGDDTPESVRIDSPATRTTKHVVHCDILSLAERRNELGKRFFRRIIKDKSNYLVIRLS